MDSGVVTLDVYRAYVKCLLGVSQSVLVILKHGLHFVYRKDLEFLGPLVLKEV